MFVSKIYQILFSKFGKFLVWQMKNSSILVKSIRIFVFIIKSKSSLFTSIFTFSIISKFWKQDFMYFARKHVETEPSRLHTQREIPGYSNLINTVKFVFDHIFRSELSLEELYWCPIFLVAGTRIINHSDLWVSQSVKWFFFFWFQ